MNKAAILTVTAGFAIATIAAYKIYDLHSQDFCIAKKRQTTDKEMFLAALTAPGAYLNPSNDVDNLYELMVNDGVRTGRKVSERNIYFSDELRERQERHTEQLYEGQMELLYNGETEPLYRERKSYISRLLDDPKYVARCCKRVEPDAENGGRLTGRKRFSAVLFGQSPLLARIRFERIAANPDYFDPPLAWNNERERWEATTLPLKLAGPATPESKIQQEHRKYYYMKMDVCGEAIIEKD